MTKARKMDLHKKKKKKKKRKKYYALRGDRESRARRTLQKVCLKIYIYCSLQDRVHFRACLENVGHHLASK